MENQRQRRYADVFQARGIRIVVIKLLPRLL